MITGAQFFIKLKGEKELTDGKTTKRCGHPASDSRNPFQAAPTSASSGMDCRCKGGPAGLSEFDIAAYLTESFCWAACAARRPED